MPDPFLIYYCYYAHPLDSARAIAASLEQSTGDGDRASLEQSTGDDDRASFEQSTGEGSPPQNGHVTIATTSFAHALQTRALQHGSSSASSPNSSWQTPQAGGGIVAPGGGAGVVAGGGAGAITWSPGGGAGGGAVGGAAGGAIGRAGGGAGGECCGLGQTQLSLFTIAHACEGYSFRSIVHSRVVDHTDSTAYVALAGTLENPF